MPELISTDSEAVATAADDFGHLVHRRPAGVVTPASPAELAATVVEAAQRGQQVVPQGRRHSVYGRAQVADGLVLDLACLSAIHSVDNTRTVVEAGATWRSVVAATLPQGLVPPVLTDHLDLSVGGTLTVGGVGAASTFSGVQTDHVLALDVVTGDGRLSTCSRGAEPDLFDAVRAGLGQSAIIARATLQLVPAPLTGRHYEVVHTTLPDMIDSLRATVAAGFSEVQGSITPSHDGSWSYRVNAVAYDELPTGPTPLTLVSSEPFEGHVRRFEVLEQAMRDSGLWDLPHPWLTSFVGDSQVEQLVAALLGRLDPSDGADLGPAGQVILSPLHRRSMQTPLLRLPDEHLCFAFNFIRFPTTDHPDEIDRLLAANRAIYERLRDSGTATLYPVAALDLSVDDWRTHFGSRHAGLVRSKHTYDPAGVLANGYSVVA